MKKILLIGFLAGFSVGIMQASSIEVPPRERAFIPFKELQPKTSGKRVAVEMPFVAPIAIAQTDVAPIVTEDLSPAGLKARLIGKYQGKINGIEQLSRSITDFVGIVDASTLNQKIDTAVNKFVGMGTIDVDAVEADIEKAIYGALKSIFDQSISLASKSYRHEISKDLFAIAPWNEKIVWNPAQTHVLMLTWIPGAYKATYETALNSRQEMDIKWNAWVTAVPEVKDFLTSYMNANKNSFSATDRVEQFLGLLPSKPPYATSQNKFFVEMWVRPEDLFRPCLDAEICGTECTIDPHESDLDHLPPAFRDMAKLIPMTPEHRAWFEKEKKGAYKGDWAMPWTRFGYTYDWGSLKKAQGKRAAKGATEYLIKAGSKVLVHSIISTEQYPDSVLPTSGYTYTE